ncbi:restriction system modified-DNA reader domain-containing protein [Cellulomonas sp. URHB0016]
MPIFELDEGRPRLVQPMQPLAGSFGQECASLLTHHLAAVAGEPLFAVRFRTGASDHADLPELLALDATGRAVVVEVVQVVDDDAIVTALRHAGIASRMTSTDFARAYHVDPGRFAVDFAGFREQVAFGTHTSRREGVRLIVLCSEVAAEAGDTLGFLRGPGRHVDVLQVGVVRGVDDRRLLDVSPLATHEGVRRPVEPTALRLVRSSEAFATAMAYQPERDSHLPTTNPRKALTGELRAVTPPQARPGPPAPTPLARRSSATEPTPLPFGSSGQGAGDGRDEDDPTGDGAEPKDDSRNQPPRTPWSAAPADAHDHTDPAGLPPVTTLPSVPAPGTSRTVPSKSTARPSSATFRPAPATLTPIAGLRAAADDRVRPRPGQADELAGPGGPRPFVAPVGDHGPASTPATGTSPADAAQPPTRPEPLVPLPELATLAKSRRAVTTLVWLRERRGQRFVATLRPDGLLQLSNGRTFADPDAAATSAADSESTLDGWRAWRLGDGGPTLAEAAGVTHR